MRVVRDQASFKENFERAVSEAKSAFGDGTVFIERELTVEKPRTRIGLLGKTLKSCICSNMCIQDSWITLDISKFKSWLIVTVTLFTCLNETVRFNVVTKR